MLNPILQIKSFSFTASRFIAIALGISIPISVALDNLLLLLSGILFVPWGAGKYWEICKTNPVARASIALFVMLMIGVAYGQAPLSDGIGILGKYIDLAYIPIFMILFRDENIRRAALNAFLVVMTSTLILSLLVGCGLIPRAEWMNQQAGEPVIFHGYIAQNFLMAFTAFLFFLKFKEPKNTRAGLVYLSLAVISSYNVLFMVTARTGPLVLFGLTVYLALALQMGRTKLDIKKLSVAIAVTLLAILLTYQLSPKFHGRIVLMTKEVKEWDSQQPPNETSSIGLRLRFYYETLQIIAANPLIGVGTGGFSKAFSGRIGERGSVSSENPHNGYLLITTQIGLIGLALLLYLFCTMWKSALHIENYFERNAGIGLVISVALDCLVNSPLLDHTEGIFFAFMSALLFANIKSKD